MRFRKVAYTLHLWLGIISGLIVFIVCLTGAIWALRINGWVGETSQDDSECPPTEQNQSLLLPSQLITITSEKLGNEMPNNISYTKEKPARVTIYGKNYRYIKVNPYTGEMLGEPTGASKKDDSFDLWRFVGTGHRSLWLPWEIGRPIVNYGTLVFVIVLITGLVIWFPKSKKAAKNRLWFNWKKGTPAKRKIFDLHSVLGFYVCFVLLAIAFTGMVWGIEWWSKGLYSVTTGGKTLPEWGAAKSDTISADTSMTAIKAVDKIFLKVLNENTQAYSVSFGYPDPKDNASAISVTVYKQKDIYYNSDSYSFDRYSLQEIKIKGPYSGKYAEASVGDKLRKMNYEIHIGSIWGTPGRILVFFAAIFGASLPVTGLYIFFKTRKKKKKKI